MIGGSFALQKMVRLIFGRDFASEKCCDSRNVGTRWRCKCYLYVPEK